MCKRLLSQYTVANFRGFGRQAFQCMNMAKRNPCEVAEADSSGLHSMAVVAPSSTDMILLFAGLERGMTAVAAFPHPQIDKWDRRTVA